MRLSAFSVADAYPTAPGRPRDRLRELVRLAAAADRAGLAAFWLAEHHFHDGGVVPAPAVVLAACGERTRSIRLGVLVSVLPLHEPVEVAEQFATLDRLLGGRLNLGFGSGYIATELAGFGVDPATKRARFDAAYATVVAALRGEAVRVDRPGTPEVRLNVRPVQRPLPPVWIAVQRREALPFVARRGVSVALVPYATLGGLDELAAEVREFRAALPDGVRAEVAAAFHLYAGPRPARARAALQRYLDSRLATHSAFLQAKVARDPAHARAENVEAQGWALFGDADEVVARLDAVRAAGVDEVLGIFDFGGLAPSEVTGSVARLGRRWPR